MRKDKNLTTDNELRRLLYGGFGRAILLLREEGLTRHRDLVLHYCTRWNAHDKYLTESRADYLYPLLVESSEVRWFRDRIMDALCAVRDHGDARQLFDFAALFARDGDSAARDAIHEKYLCNDTDDPFTGAEALIRLCGTDGLITVLDLIGLSSGVGREPWEDNSLVEDAEETCGIEAVRLALQAASASPGVARVLERISSVYSPFKTYAEIRAMREEDLQRRRTRQAYPYEIPEDALWWEVKNHPLFDRICSEWARVAPDEQLQTALDDVLAENEPKRLHRLLLALRLAARRRELPTDPSGLLKLIGSGDQTTVLRALGVLEHLSHPAVRDLAFRLMDDPKWSYRAVGLLTCNHEPGDHETILHLIERESNPDNLHIIGIDVRKVYKENPSPEGIEPLLLVYKKGPCSMCRCGVVELLHEMDALPDWMIRECVYDAYSETRELASKLV